MTLHTTTYYFDTYDPDWTLYRIRTDRNGKSTVEYYTPFTRASGWAPSIFPESEVREFRRATRKEVSQRIDPK
jgi:hypothetical protein